MTIPRIYSPDELAKEKLCELGQDNHKYLRQVLRLKKGDAVTVFDGKGHEFKAVIDEFPKNKVLLKLIKEIINPPGRKIKISLAQALPKASKMDVIVRGAAELGADIIIPFTAERSVSRVDAVKMSLKAARWQKIAREAARCCRSVRITDVLPISSFEEMLGCAGENSLKLIFWEEENQTGIRNIFSDHDLVRINDIFFAVGPEGGFSKNEITQAKESGFISVSLGRQILKVETAALAIISIIQYEKGIFSNSAKGGE